MTASTDGQSFQPIVAERESYSAGRGDYGYLAPVLYKGKGSIAKAEYLRITVPASASRPAQDGQKSAAPAPGEAAFPLQISRVEIDFGPAE